MYLNAFTLSSLASTTAWTHWFLPLFAANWQMNPRLKTLVFLQQTPPITAKACRKFSNSCFRDLSCFSELSLWRKSCSLKMPKSSETIYWYCLICVPLSFTMVWTHRQKVIHSTLHQYRLYSTYLFPGRWHLRTHIPILILQLSFEVPIALHTAVVRFADTQYYLRTSDRLFLVQELTSWLAITFLRQNVYLK